MEKSDSDLWCVLNRRMVAKTISELHYEECILPEENGNAFGLRLKSGVQYQFNAWLTLWGQLRVNHNSLLRNGKSVDCAAQFFVDARQELELTDIILGNLLEECYQTLAGDMNSWRLKNGVSARQLAQMDVDAMQPYLDGHPKAVLNKGRIGWGLDALEQYAPEANQPIQLRWLAVRKSLVKMGTQYPDAINRMVADAMSADELSVQNSIAESLGVSGDNWITIPVHPWQWQKVIQIQYQAWISRGDLVDLGVRGHNFLPLQSIRTLANVTEPQAHNVKMPLTILNTSCYRGIPGKYIEVGAALSQWLSDVCESDPLLYDSQTVVLKEPLGVHVPHPLYEQIESAPYRYNETLGVIWRESMQSKLKTGERAMLVAALLQADNHGYTIVESLIRESGLPAKLWLERYFQAVVIPLYHLMCCYGIGLVAHGQNLTLVVESGVPKRLALKDLQGDLRIVDEDFPELISLPGNIKQVLTRLPAAYLLHDLQTGHFVTVLRYFSALLQEQKLISESVFYQVLASVIKEYQLSYPQLQPRFRQFDLLTDKIKRVCINRVRFKQGYGDSDERPLPTLGSDIPNPLVVASQYLEKEPS